jgi:myosin heavy subunit
MSQKKGSAVIVLIILIFFALASIGGVFFLFQQERTKNTGLSDELDDLKTRQKITEAKLEEARRVLSAFEKKLKQTQEQVRALNIELEKEKAAKEDALLQLEQSKAGLQQQKNLKSELENKLTSVQKEANNTAILLKDLLTKKSELENQVANLQDKAHDLEDKLHSLEVEKSIANPKDKTGKKAIVPSVAKKELAGKTVEGRVLVVNKDYNFAVINLGAKDGIRTGDLFTISHNNKILGDAKVSKVHDSMSAADFLFDQMKTPVAEGDKVARKFE